MLQETNTTTDAVPTTNTTTTDAVPTTNTTTNTTDVAEPEPYDPDSAFEYSCYMCA
jgi:hypothetical protein